MITSLSNKSVREVAAAAADADLFLSSRKQLLRPVMILLYQRYYGTDRKEKSMITSLSNKSVREVVLLNQKAKARNKQGLFVVEGPKMFAEAPSDNQDTALENTPCAFYSASTLDTSNTYS